MAKSRKQSPKGKESTPSKGEASPSSVIVSVRVSPDFRGWLDRLAEHERIGLSDLFDRALTRYAREAGFKEAPPKR